MEEFARARRVLATVAATWPRLPRPVTEAVGQLLSHADHTHRLRQVGRDGGVALDEGFAASRDRVLQIVLGAAEAPATGPPFASYAIDLILDDDTHPFLICSAAHGPRGGDGAQADLLARDLRRLQSLAAAVDRALGLHGCAAAWADRAAGGAAPPPRRDPFALEEYPWSPRGPRAELRRRFLRESDWGALHRALGDLVRRYGMGEGQGCVAFRLEGDRLAPIRDFAAFDLAWLSGIEERVAVLNENTRNLLEGYRAHNALIWGPRGCGKSTLIRGLITRYWEAGLRGIEVPPESYGRLRDLLGRVRGRRECYVAVLDNLALDRRDPASRLLSTVLDGGLEEMPRNLVFYATSNYKDLVDREGERPQGPPPLQVDGVPAARRTTDLTTAPVHGYDPQGLQRLDERRALDDRFALKVFIDLPTKPQYEQLVVDYARRAGVDVVEPELLAEFHVWRMRHNHDLVGGRTARDFILSRYPDHLRREGMG